VLLETLRRLAGEADASGAVEVIVVDDGSDDDTREAVSAFAAASELEVTLIE
jgi:glycosyltransferase involved in cell wall biosynthesis